LVSHSCLILLLILLCIFEKLRHLEALWYKAFWDFVRCAFGCSFSVSLFYIESAMEVQWLLIWFLILMCILKKPRRLGALWHKGF
jgi:hypothetical protein